MDRNDFFSVTPIEEEEDPNIGSVYFLKRQVIAVMGMKDRKGSNIFFKDLHQFVAQETPEEIFKLLQTNLH